MEEEKEGEREEGGKRAAEKPLDAGRKRGRRERGKEGSGKTAARKKKGEGKEERRKRGSGKTAARREEEGRREGDWGGSKKNPLHLVRDGADLLIVGGIRGDYLRSTFLPFLMTMPL